MVDITQISLTNNLEGWFGGVYLHDGARPGCWYRTTKQVVYQVG